MDHGLTGARKRYLKGLAHSLKPVVFVGSRGITESVLQSTDEALLRHELIKVKLIDFKERDRKAALVNALASDIDASLVGVIGHVAILYRPHPEPDQRRITPPD
jgi:RNA-binding protein